MTISYSLHTESKLSPDAVLKTLFGYEAQDIAGAQIVYVRGRVFLAHGRATDIVISQRLFEQYHISSNVSVLFFPDGISSFQTALDELALGLARWVRTSADGLIALANEETVVWQYQNQSVTINQLHTFWTPNRIAHFNKHQ